MIEGLIGTVVVNGLPIVAIVVLVAAGIAFHQHIWTPLKGWLHRKTAP